MSSTLFIKRLIYQLKRQYGFKIFIYQSVLGDVDYKTGIKTVNKTVFTIKRAIVLPYALIGKFMNLTSEVINRKELNQSGTFEVGQRIFVLDLKDVPDGLNMDSFTIIFDRREFQISKMTEFYDKRGLVILGKVTSGPPAAEIIVKSVKNRLRFTTTVSNE